MGSIWLRDAADVARRGGLVVLEVPGWESRSNSSGGFEAMKGVVVHHTASGPSADGWPDVNYETFHDGQKPNAMWKIDRKGFVYVMTAGSANTQGLGGPIIGVPLNRGNFQLMGIEMSNNGVGEPYPAAQQNSCLLLCRALVREYGARFGWNHNSVISHFEWAPARKNDPSGPSRWSPNGGRWNMNAFRADVGAAQLPGEDEMTPQEAGQAVWWFPGNNRVDGSKPGQGDMLSFAHWEAHQANEKADRLVADMAVVIQKLEELAFTAGDPAAVVALVKKAFRDELNQTKLSNPGT